MFHLNVNRRVRPALVRGHGRPRHKGLPLKASCPHLVLGEKSATCRGVREVLYRFDGAARTPWQSASAMASPL